MLLRAAKAATAAMPAHAPAGQLAPERHEEYRLAADPS
jgi:hypothetical protein